MPLDKACYDLFVWGCIEAITWEIIEPPLYAASVIGCTIAGLLACSSPDLLGADLDSPDAQVGDGTVLANNGLDPTVPTTLMPQPSGELDPSDPSQDGGDLGNAPSGDGSGIDYANDWGDTGGGGGGGGGGWDAGPAHDEDDDL